MKRVAPQLSDQALDRALSNVVANENAATALVLDHIAEYDQRKLYLPAGYSSMFAYCTEHLHMSEDAAYKRIQAARAALRFPGIFTAVADGRLHLSAVCLLAPHLVEGTASELLRAAVHKTKRQIEVLLAKLFPQPDLATCVTPMVTQLAPGQVATPIAAPQPAPVAGVQPTALDAFTPPTRQDDRATTKPLAPQRFALQVTIDAETHDALRYLQDLLSHELPAGDVAAVLKMAFEALIPQVEQRRFAATDQPRSGRPTKSLRHIPAHVRRAVWVRDRGQCTFVGENGHRCSERRFIEFDHAREVARGGEASVDQVRLRCRAHNQYTAECTFGAEFMRHKRAAAAESRDRARTSPARQGAVAAARAGARMALQTG